MATVIRQTLADQVKMSQLIGTQLSTANKDSLLMLSECIYHLLTATNFGECVLALNLMLLNVIISIAYK